MMDRSLAEEVAVLDRVGSDPGERVGTSTRSGPTAML